MTYWGYIKKTIKPLMLLHCGGVLIGKAKRCSHANRQRIDKTQPQVVKVYKLGVVEVNRLDQNLAACS